MYVISLKTKSDSKNLEHHHDKPNNSAYPKRLSLTTKKFRGTCMNHISKIHDRLDIWHIQESLREYCGNPISIARKRVYLL